MMITDRYDFANPPAAEDWLAMDEGERIARVEDAHRKTGAVVGKNATIHASIHVVVENQLAMGEVATIAAYDRCRAAGLDRHMTIHALASVVTVYLVDMLEQRERFDQARADRDFAALDPTAWMPNAKTRT